MKPCLRMSSGTRERQTEGNRQQQSDRFHGCLLNLRLSNKPFVSEEPQTIRVAGASLPTESLNAHVTEFSPCANANGGDREAVQDE
jgi:hypothetical protein